MLFNKQTSKGTIVTANRGKSRLIWTSYGIIFEVYYNLNKKEQIELQKLNKFFYRIAVGRVQTKIMLILPTYLFSNSFECSKVIKIVDRNKIEQI